MAQALDTARSSDFSTTSTLYGYSPRATGASGSQHTSSVPGMRNRASLGGALQSTTMTGTPRDSGMTYMYQTGEARTCHSEAFVHVFGVELEGLPGRHHVMPHGLVFAGS